MKIDSRPKKRDKNRKKLRSVEPFYKFLYRLKQEASFVISRKDPEKN